MLYKEEGAQRLEHCNENWPKAYYEENNPQIRKEMLEKIEQDESVQDEALSIRKDLWNLRYGTDERQKSEIDYFIRGLVYLKSVFTQMDALFAKKRCKKLLEDAKKDLCMDQYVQNGEVFQAVLKEEWTHLAEYYFKICTEDKNFSTGALGFFKLKDEEIIDKIAEEVITIVLRVPLAMDQEDEFQMIAEIFMNAFANTFYNGRDIITQKASRIKRS